MQNQRRVPFRRRRQIVQVRRVVALAGLFRGGSRRPILLRDFQSCRGEKNGARGFDFCLIICHQFIFALVGTISLWFIVCNREYINKFLDAMENVNCVLSELKIPATENLNLGCIFLALNAVFLCVLKYFVRCMSFHHSSDIIEAITTISTQVIVIGTMTAFTSFVRQILSELEVLNHQLGLLIVKDTSDTFKGKYIYSTYIQHHSIYKLSQYMLSQYI